MIRANFNLEHEHDIEVEEPDKSMKKGIWLRRKKVKHKQNMMALRDKLLTECIGQKLSGQFVSKNSSSKKIMLSGFLYSPYAEEITNHHQLKKKI